MTNQDEFFAMRISTLLAGARLVQGLGEVGELQASCLVTRRFVMASLVPDVPVP